MRHFMFMSNTNQKRLTYFIHCMCNIESAGPCLCKPSKRDRASPHNELFSSLLLYTGQDTDKNSTVLRI